MIPVNAGEQCRQRISCIASLASALRRPAVDKLISERYESARCSGLTASAKRPSRPNYVDSSGSDIGADVAGDFVISDPPVGFTVRGSSNSSPFDPSGWWW